MPSTTVRSRHVDLRPADNWCPHCGGNLAYVIRVRKIGYGWRCQSCRCVWDVHGNLSKWGSRCPLYTRA